MLQAAAAAAGAGVSFAFSHISSLILLAVSAVIIAAEYISDSRRNKELLRLCDNIDRILHGEDNIDFNDYQEGVTGILKAEIHKMTVKLREQNAGLKKEKMYLKESLEDISHQLRTPLTSMILINEMLTQPGLNERQKMECLREQYTLIDQMKWLIETMLNLSRIDAGAVTMRKDTIDCGELIKRSLEPLAVSLDLKGVDTEISCADNTTIEGDIHYLSEALLNLLKNCVEHTPPGGSIKISAENNPLYTGIKITDTGEGIKKEDSARIFDRFYRSSEFNKSGYGIGLSFAKKVIVSHNGSITVSNANPKGACFDIRFYKSSI